MQWQLLPLILLAASANCPGATQIASLQQAIAQQLRAQADSLPDDDTGIPDTCSDGNQAWYLNTFYLHVDPSVSFDGGFVCAQVSAQFGFIWWRPLPDGWSPYSPARQ